MSPNRSSQEQPAGPTCPFCGAAWTSGMLDQYDAMTDPNGCACCGAGSLGADSGAHDHLHESFERPRPVSDLCCDSCGRALYRAHPASFARD